MKYTLSVGKKTFSARHIARATGLALLVFLALPQVHLVGASQAPSDNTAGGRVTGPASSLVGLSQAQVRSELGAPSFAQNDILFFDSPIGTLRVTFRNGMVSILDIALFAPSITGRSLEQVST